jgi:hypothetical protein
MPKPHTLSDGTTISVRTQRTIAGTFFHEVPSRKRKASSLYLLDTQMFALFGPRQDMIPVRHPDYSYAKDDKEGARVALAMFVDGAEACIREAEKEGLPVERMYSTD